MKAIGVRRVDQLGRLVLPMDLRDSLRIGPQTPMDIFYEDENIVLRKHRPVCCICKGTENLQDFKGKLICANCVEALERESAGA